MAKRYKHRLSHYSLNTFDMGELVPVGMYEVLPGDTVEQHTSALLRVAPLASPVMHPVEVNIRHYYVPYRILWSSFEKFITGGEGGANANVLPHIKPSAAQAAAGGILDYLGIKPGVNYGGSGAPGISALPLLAYHAIFNEHYRDQDFTTAKTDSTDTDGDITATLFADANFNVLRKVNWEKDYFTRARPWTQKGTAITLPLGTTAPVVGKAGVTPVFTSGSLTGSGLLQHASGTNPAVSVQGSVGAGNFLQFSSTTTGLEVNLAGATAASVNDLRNAFALQKFMENRALYGGRYTEYLRYLGVRGSDARLSRPEYLGGSSRNISFSEVLATAETGTTTDVGDLKGHGIAAERTPRFRRFFEEHGVVMTLMYVRPRTMYADAINRMWYRKTNEDFWQRELEHIGQQAILAGESYPLGTSADSNTWGYTNRYDEYRSMFSRVAGDFRSSVMNHWHLAQVFGGATTLNESFIQCNPSKRIAQIQTNDILWVMANHSIVARRLVSRSGQPGGI